MSKYSQDFEFDADGLGNMTSKISTETVTPQKTIGDSLNYSFDYVYDENYAHRLVSAGERYYNYDANGNIICEQDCSFELNGDDNVSYHKVVREAEDVYSTDYGWGLFKDDADNGARGTKYRRTYEWNERNQLISSIDANYNTAYLYGQDGQRSNKYTANSETLYFNKMWTLHTDSGNAVYGGQTAKNIYLGDTRIVTKLNSGGNPAYQEEYYKQYYYHSDHLGSASLITDCNGDEYQRIEYTPYGEIWVDKTENTGLEFLPYRFTGKEQDEETGLYYYGARYLDSRYSRWISTDPALKDYIPQAPVSDEARKNNQNLPGMGGVFNHINSNLYHYAGNNPIRYIAPDGNSAKNSTNDNIYIKFENPKKDENGNKKYGMLLRPGEKYVGRVDGVITPDGTIKKVSDSEDSPLLEVNIDVRKSKEGKFTFSLGLSAFINFLGDMKKKLDRSGKENDTSTTFSPEEVAGSTVESWLEHAKKEFGEPRQWNSYKEPDDEQNK